MEPVNHFSETFGGVWISVSFFETIPPTLHYTTEKTVRFCQAVREGRKHPLLLTADVLECPGARRGFGWDPPHGDGLLEKMSERIALSRDGVSALLDQTPRLKKPIEAILIGSDETPDILISYAQPVLIMKLLRHFQKLTGENLKTDLSSIHSVCAHVAVKTYLSGNICLSFGCDDAREHGSIPRDRLVIGIPYRTARMLTEAFDEYP